MKRKLSASSLKRKIWETMLGVENKKIDPRSASIVLSGSRELMRIVKIQIEAAKLNGGNLTSDLMTGIYSVDQNKITEKKTQ